MRPAAAVEVSEYTRYVAVDVINKPLFSKAFAWIERFKQVLEAKQAQAQPLNGSEAEAVAAGVLFAEVDAGVDTADPVLAVGVFEKRVGVKM
ncbi:hypothetical protein F4804DRAFT_334610 [Jackrogersella minutella]|nr:hypothetical protein F4804DRAFT_334610 [Jackrogersella minutella]